MYNPGVLTLHWHYDNDPSVCLGLLFLMTEIKSREACPFLCLEASVLVILQVYEINGYLSKFCCQRTSKLPQGEGKTRRRIKDKITNASNVSLNLLRTMVNLQPSHLAVALDDFCEFVQARGLLCIHEGGDYSSSCGMMLFVCCRWSKKENLTTTGASSEFALSQRIP